MSRNFWNLFSATSRATFGALTPPVSPSLVSPGQASLGQASPGQAYPGQGSPSLAAPQRTRTPAEYLSQAGSESLKDVVDRRDKAKLFQMGHVDELGQPSPIHSHLSNSIKDFFLSDPTHLEKHRNYEAFARRPNQYFDIRQVGTATESHNTDGVRSTQEFMQIFCCRYGEELQAQQSSKTSLTLAIPSHAGLRAPDAISLINPLSMMPREYIDEGEAGAILCFSPTSQRYVADLYWSPSAFVHSLSEVQTIGTMLIKTDAMKEAADTGVGVVDVHRASAILAKLYEAVAQVGQAEDEPFFSAGMWGVAVLPQKNNTYQCLIGVVALNIPNLSDERPEQTQGMQSLFLSKRNFAVARFSLYRDDFGFLKISSENCSLHPLEPLPWFDRLPKVA